jgi:hypothetical protein
MEFQPMGSLALQYVLGPLTLATQSRTLTRSADMFPCCFLLDQPFVHEQKEQEKN